ncbi:unnamed protein product [Brassica oleracea]
MGGLWTNEKRWGQRQPNNGKGNEGKVEKRKGGDDVKGKGNGNGPKDKDKNKNEKGKKDKDKKGRIRRKTRSRVEQLLVDTGCFHLCPQDKSRPCARVRVHIITNFLLLKSTGVANHLYGQLNNSDNIITIFAPSDSSFSSLKAGTLNTLTDE